ncbi:hypothetical protein WMF28_40180 [Sorangium sp. So ce590]|uniref:hypothetical protein n=1 Tax=Sorangium sp. So ce590 TaxID=3133317 RepID=UPI003F5DDF0E
MAVISAVPELKTQINFIFTVEPPFRAFFLDGPRIGVPYNRRQEINNRFHFQQQDDRCVMRPRHQA